MADPSDIVDFGRYRLLRPLGRGGMAEVYLAESQGPMSFRKLVAIKRLLPLYAKNKRYIQMLLDEAHISGGISHPNVVQVIDLGDVEGVHYIAMEYINGLDLATALRSLRSSQKVIPIEVALHIARCVARGLHAAHTLVDQDQQPMRVVHRDVSPHNVLLSTDGEVKLIDFGVAKAETNLTMTRSGVIKGKLQYMSPEQAQAKPVDCRADVFSLGMTLYKMLVGRLPFSGSNEFQIYDEILRKKVSPPSSLRPEISERVDALVLRSLRKSADERFQTADEMARVIDRALEPLTPMLDAADIAAWLAADLPAERQFTTDEADDFRSNVGEGGDAGGPGTDPPASWDNARVDRLTRVDAPAEAPEVLLPTVRASVALDPADRHGVTTVDRLEPLPTLQLQVAGLSLGNDTRAESRSQRAQAEPASVQLGAGGGGAGVEPASVESVHTSHLTSLRPRRPVFIMLGVIGVLASILAVLILQEGGEPQPLQAAQRPRSTAVSRLATGPGTQAGIASVVGAPPVTDGRNWDRPALSEDAPSLSPTAPPTPPTTDPAKTPASASAPTRAYVTVSTLPWAWVSIDGQRLPRHTPVVAAPVRPGRHVVRMEAGDGRVHSVEINVRAGQRLTLSHAFK